MRLYKYRLYDARLALFHQFLQTMLIDFGVMARAGDADFVRHIFRELNGEADALAGRHAYTYVEHTSRYDFRCFRYFFDGSCPGASSGGGWVLYGAMDVVSDTECEWTKIASLSFPLDAGSTVTAAELEAALWGMAYLLSRLKGKVSVEEHVETWQPQTLATDLGFVWIHYIIVGDFLFGISQSFLDCMRMLIEHSLAG